MATTGLRIAEVLRQSGLITPSEVLQNLARTGRTTKKVSREAQALRNYREEAVNIDDKFLQSMQARVRGNQQVNPLKDLIKEHLDHN